ncbi:hypothetical protein EJ04DRAFT_507161 [Polyplosphaeria fusca]|uniref:SET domain-containing protein n=1 Tax=Polyplosphaeria fusca TaxID=682080 RepID=A0A9P4RDS9_9PLEO|nr:hypothetical protein EJ04DRAFT_507161 [Polyplosphaeria fusca]
MAISNGISGLRQKLSALADLQCAVHREPYSVALRLNLAQAYRDLGYPDLGAGEAYKALLLVDEITDEGEYYDAALDSARADVMSNRAADNARNMRRHHQSSNEVTCYCQEMLELKKSTGDKEDEEDEEKTTKLARTCWSISAYTLLIPGLIDCGCLRSAHDLNSRAQITFANIAIFGAYKDTLETRLQSYFKCSIDRLREIDVQHYPEKGFVRRELYPWNDHEPDRFSSTNLLFLNKGLAAVAPKLEVKAVDLPVLTSDNETSTESSLQNTVPPSVTQLGVFAKEDIEPGEVILCEKSLLTAVSRLHDTYCDACSATLPRGNVEAGHIAVCEECDSAFFCSAECHDLAQENYHPAICGVSIEQKVSASEAADMLYSLLLVRALALAETRKQHPLQLKEVRYIWGDYHGLDLEKQCKSDSDPFCSVPQTLPFSFDSNVLFPIHIMEKMDINIFEQSHQYDTWIFNTLYAKFRGTASAQQGAGGWPETGAVHPLWCLANHSCDPNVAWEWQGSMKFWARESLVDWKGRNASIVPGLRSGDEVLGHYCDIRLPVKERREWAVGALGGDCMCPRCVWEASSNS